MFYITAITTLHLLMFLLWVGLPACLADRQSCIIVEFQGHFFRMQNRRYSMASGW